MAKQSKKKTDKKPEIDTDYIIKLGGENIGICRAGLATFKKRTELLNKTEIVALAIFLALATTFLLDAIFKWAWLIYVMFALFAIILFVGAVALGINIAFFFFQLSYFR